jgi:hypothetical protein
MPRFSVVVPTRDRPDLVDFCLESLAGQWFEDAEVIVSDNPTTASARAMFDRWAGPGWRYLRQERPLAMHDNFELACAEASGEFVAVVIDKTVLHPSALEFADRALATDSGIDIVTWWNEGYNPVDEEHKPGRGRFAPVADSAEPALYDPAAELDRRFANAARRGSDPIHYVRGKIVFGAFSRRLLDRIREQTGRVFHPLAPDYSSMVPACVLAEGAVDLGRPLLVSYNSARSNGRRQALDAGHARRFVEAADPAILGKLPITGVYASHHNVVAYDLVSSAARCPAGSTPSLDMPNLLRRAREDLDAVQWSDPGERDSQYALLERAETEHGVVPERSAPAERSRVPEVVSRLAARRSRQMAPTYGSPVEAARVADRHYSLTGSA